MNKINTIKLNTFEINIFDCGGNGFVFSGPERDLTVTECAWFCEAFKQYNHENKLISKGRDEFQFMVATSGKGQLWAKLA